MSCHAPTSTTPHRNPTPLTPAQRAAFEALAGLARPARTLADEVFALAVRDLDDWPLARQRLRRARRFLRATRRAPAPADDLWFAAQLVARALDADVGLTGLEIAALFEAIGLPTDAVRLDGAPSGPRTALARRLAARVRALGPSSYLPRSTPHPKGTSPWLAPLAPSLAIATPVHRPSAAATSVAAPRPTSA